MTTPSDAFFARPFAHRGLHDGSGARPENSRAAIMAAVAAGYGVELDVQLSADGEAMVFHDAKLRRMTGAPGLLRDATAAQLARMRLAGSAEVISTLPEILEAVAGRAALLVEIKTQGGAAGALEARVAQLLSRYAGPVAAMSFNPASVAALAAQAPGLARGLVACAADGYPAQMPQARRAALARMERFDEIGAQFASYDATALDAPCCAALRRRGVPLICWTITDQAAANAALTRCDQITFEGFSPASGGLAGR